MRAALLSPAKTSTAIIRFTYGEADALYPDASNPVDILASMGLDPVSWEGETYLPVPAMNIELPTRSGSLEEDVCTITLPTTVRQHAEMQSMARALASPRAPYPVSVRITQILQSSQGNVTPLVLYDGKLVNIIRNPKGKRDQVDLEFLPDLKLRMEDLTLGLRADAVCSSPFGLACGAITEKMPLFDSGTYYTGAVGPGAAHYAKKRVARVLLTLDPDQPRLVTFDFDPTYHSGSPSIRTLTQQPTTWWIRSLLCRNGLFIPIQEWRWNDPALPWGGNQFILHRLPPRDWDGASVLLRLDCPRTRDACVHRANEDNFNGSGIEIPAYNPVFEQTES